MSATHLNHKKAFAWTIAHAMFFSLTGAFVKKVSEDITIFQQVFYRAAFAVAVICLLSRPDWSEVVHRKALPLLIARGAFGFLGVTAMFYAMSELPLAIAMVLTLTTPVFVMIVGHFSVGEKIGLGHVLPAALTLIGTLLLMDIDVHEDFSVGLPVLPIAIGLVGSFLTAIAFLSMRGALQIVGTKVVVFWFALCNLFGAGVLSIGHYATPKMHDLIYILAICILGIMSDYTKTTAYRYAMAWYVSLVSLVSVLFSTMLGWSLFGDMFSSTQALGIAIVIIGISLTIMSTRPKSCKATVGQDTLEEDRRPRRENERLL